MSSHLESRAAVTPGEADVLAIRMVDRFRSLPVVWRDRIGAGLFAIGLCFGLWDDGATYGLSFGARTVVSMVLSCIALAFRRVRPVEVGLVTAGLPVLAVAMGQTASGFVAVGAAYSLTAWQPRRDVLVAVAAMMAINAAQAPLAVLRVDNEAPLLRNVPPRLDDLAALFERLSSAGLNISADVSDDLSDLGESAQACVYRIIQEALTNSVRHGEAAEVSVSACRDQRHVVVEVADNGTGAVEPVRFGHGLTGIRERAALFAGTVDCETYPGDGFTVRVRLTPEADPAREAAA